MVLRPTLNVSQFRIARDCVCSMVTSWRPPSVPVRGLLAPSHLACAPSAIHSPPGASPSGTAVPLAAAAARAAACAACCAATAAAVRFRLSSERCNCWRDCACWRALLPMPARLPSGMRPVRCAVDCTAPLSANQAGLKARACACAAPLQPPATSSTANACDTCVGRQRGRPRPALRALNALPPRCANRVCMIVLPHSYRGVATWNKTDGWKNADRNPVINNSCSFPARHWWQLRTATPRLRAIESPRRRRRHESTARRPPPAPARSAPAPGAGPAGC